MAAFAMAAATAFSPWIVKNAAETVAAEKPISIGSLLSGEIGLFVPDYSKILSAEELAKIEANRAASSMSASGKTTNEDLGRYFGYEDGVNNYLKLPFNLTYQKNQPGEYTEISFVYLALLPAILLFLSYRRPEYAYAVVAVLAFEYAYFFHPGHSATISSAFAKFLLPGGYLVIATIVLAPLAWFHFTLDRSDRRNELFLLNFAFLAFYGFVFVISAFGIVWYGIAVYFSLLLAIAIAGDEISDSDGAGEDSGTLRARFAVSSVVFVTFATYLLNSAIPHGWNNFRSAGFESYKAGRLTQDEATFESHPDYLTILGTLNLKDQKSAVSEALAAVKNEATRKVLSGNGVGIDTPIGTVGRVLSELVSTTPEAVGGAVPAEVVRAMNEDARVARKVLYERVLYPKPENRNESKIYRIGTFLTYFITDNRTRYLDDSLVQSFGEYLYDESAEKTVQRLKGLGVKYLLMDLNAATIDRDPRHDLTTRYENLLKTVRSDKLRLVKTDSLCLEAALELNRAGRPMDEYLTIAGVNFESYAASGVLVRTQKLNLCRNFLTDLIKSGAGTDESHPYLKPLADYVRSNMESGKIRSNDQIRDVVNQVVTHGWFALFEIQ